jgi:hypothetical protein
MEHQFVARKTKPAPRANAGWRTPRTADKTPGAPSAVPRSVREVLRSAGEPLDAATRAYMEPRFGHDFSEVRVHADARAAEAASSIDARAFTSGRSIVFGDGEYAAQTQPGRQLLAHELTHVVQQGAGNWRSGQEHDAYEQNANATAERVVQSRSGGQLLEANSHVGSLGLAGSTLGEIGLQKKSKGEQPPAQDAAQTVKTSDAPSQDDPALDELAEKVRNKLSKYKAYRGVIDDMMNIEQEMAVKQAGFKAKDLDDIVHEIEMRYFVVQTMQFVAKVGERRFQFPNPLYMINNYYWEPFDESRYSEKGSKRNIFRPDYHTAVGSTAANALEDIFSANSNNKVMLDCNAMMVAIQYEGMRQAFGDEKFNKMFPESKQGLFIGPIGDPNQQVYPSYGSSEQAGTKNHPFLQLGLYTETTYTPSSFSNEKAKAELVTGEWVYFENHTDYVRCHPNGMWSGEHAMYIGDGKFMGFGLGAALTYDEVLNELQSQYVKACGDGKRAGLITTNMPGIVKRFAPNTGKLEDLPKVRK